MKKIFLLFFGVLILTSCTKEYEIEMERIEMYGSQYNGIDTKKKKFNAKNDEDAAEDAFLQYLSAIHTAHHMKGDSFYWIPVKYTVRDKDGNRLPQLSQELKIKQNQYLLVTPEIEDWYKEMLGYKFLGTPYFEVYMNDK